MMKMNKSNWREFKVEDIFELVNSKAYHKNDVIKADELDNHFINYITRSKFNNGLNMIVKRSDSFIVNPANTISFGAENADFFLQEEEYITGNKMYYIDTRKYSKEVNLFLKTVFQNTFNLSYSYNHGLTATRLRKEIINLPVDNEGKPDWVFMEEFIKSLKPEVNERLNKLKNIENIEVYPLNIKSWKYFKLEELFECIHQGQRVRIVDQVEGNLPFVMAGFENKGIKKHISNDVFRFPPNSITMDVFGNLFYRDYVFGASDDVGVYYNEENQYTKNQMLFIITVFERVLGNRSFNNKIRASKTKKMELPLPINENGQLDLEYMDIFVEELSQLVNSKFKKLSAFIV